MPQIHPTAIIHEGAKIAENAVIGPYCIIGKNVRLGNVHLKSHVSIDGNTFIDDGTEIHPFAVIGEAPQIAGVTKFKKSEISIGKNCILREHVTIHPGSDRDDGVTVIGDNCILMVGCHVGHDCHFGHHVIMANNVIVAGHVRMANYITIGGMTAIHQKVRIGSYAMIGGMTGIECDVIPYGMVYGERGHLRGLNWVGMKRHGIDKADRIKLKHIFDDLFCRDEGVLVDRVKDVQEKYSHIQGEALQNLIDFILSPSPRGLTQYKSGSH